MKLTVTQDVTKLNIKATQESIMVELQPVLNQVIQIPATAETDPIFTASEAHNFVAGDKANLDNQSGINTGDETTITIKTKRPLKTIDNQSLEGTGNIAFPDISGKLDKVTTNDVEKVYIKNANGTQAVKPTSDFIDIIQGYFNGTNFYSDALYTNLITPDATKLYISKNGNLSYRYEVGYVQVGAEKPFEIIDVVESAVAIDSNPTLLKEYNIGKLSGFKQIDLKVLFKRVGPIGSHMKIIIYLTREDNYEDAQLGFNYYSGVNVSRSFFKRTITLREINNQIEYYSKDSSSPTDENTLEDNTILNGFNFNFNWKIRVVSISPNFKTYHTNIIKQ